MQSDKKQTPAHALVHAPGTEVRIVAADISAKIKAVYITELGISYDLQWWSGRELRSAYFLDSDFEATTPPNQQIGFHGTR